MLWVLNVGECIEGGVAGLAGSRESGRVGWQQGGDGLFKAFTSEMVTIVFGCQAHVWCACRSGHGFRRMDCLVRSYQGCKPGALVLAGSGRWLETPKRALGYRRPDTSRPRLQRGWLRQAKVRPRVSFGKAAATAGGGDSPASQSSGCGEDPWAEHAVGTGAGTLLPSGSWHGTDCGAHSPSNER